MQLIDRVVRELDRSLNRKGFRDLVVCRQLGACVAKRSGDRSRQEPEQLAGLRCRKPEPPAENEDLPLPARQRRKNLRGAIADGPGGKRDKADVDAKLAGLGIDGKGRAEALDVEQHLRLAAAFAAE